MEAQQNDVAENQTVPVLVLTDTGIQRVAFWLRVLGGCDRHTQFDPIYVMECVIAAYDKSFNYEIIDTCQWPYSPSQEACYIPEQNAIFIRSDVYEAAQQGEFQALVTIAHEVSHYIQNLILQLLSFIPGISYKTESCAQDSIQMQAHEIQTDSITVLLFTDELFLGKSDEEIVTAYIIAPITECVCVLIEKLGEKIAKRWQSFPTTKQRREVCVV